MKGHALFTYHVSDGAYPWYLTRYYQIGIGARAKVE
jgi:hypothetical protein